jgi:flagellar FliJ protein
MAKFQFRLDNVLNIKEKFEEQKKMELYQANQTLNVEKEKLSTLIKLRDKNNDVFKNKVEKTVKIRDIREHNKTCDFYNKSIVGQNDEIEKASNQVDTIRSELHMALIEKKIYEKLKDHALEQYCIEQNISEQKVVDEIVSYKYRVQ